MKHLFFLTCAVAFTALFAGCGSKMDALDPALTTDAGVMINGVTWATRNVDAPGTFTGNVQDAGMLYQWNSKKAWPAPLTTADWPTTAAGGTTWATANDPCPKGWHIPTQAVFNQLLSASVTKTWGTFAGTKGVYFGTVAEPYQLFLPGGYYAGYVDGHVELWDNRAYYWSSTQKDSDNVYCFWMRDSPPQFNIYGDDKRNLYPVRCVQ